MSHEYANPLPNNPMVPQPDDHDPLPGKSPVDVAMLDSILAQVRAEFIAAATMHGPMHSLHEAHGVILEEFEEFWEDARRDDLPAARKELVQLAAMAVRALHDVHTVTGKAKPAPLTKQELRRIRYLLTEFEDAAKKLGDDEDARAFLAL